MSLSQRTGESAAKRVLRRVGWAVRDRWSGRPVVREVQGVRMTLPWSHRLPDYARVVPAYGQNLVKVATALQHGDEPLTVLDVGANVGDSTLQILHATDAHVLCVEADGFFLEFLHTNVDGDVRVSVEESLLTAGADDGVAMAPVRVGGTTRFEPGTSALTAPSVSTDELRSRYPAFEELRLAKSDTDGYDVELIPAIARTWSSSRPVLFFEYDHVLSRAVGNDPIAVWGDLIELGYAEVVAWDNYGEVIGRFAIGDVQAEAAVLDEPSDDRAHPYWDVAVAHTDDVEGLAALRRLVPANS